MRLENRPPVHLLVLLALALFAPHAFGDAAPEAAPVPGVPRYEIFPGPLNVNGAAEPSIGVNWVTGSVLYQYGFATYKVTFDDCGSPSIATWLDRSVPTNTASLDPIGFTDPMTGRTFASQLNGACSFTSFSDDDGEIWIPSEGCGTPAGVDHQTIGGGPFAPGPTDCHTPLYPNAVYYCSQELVTAFCALSCDGGLSFGPGVPAWNTTQCGGIHGHIKVAPDGTVYVPNKSCGGRAAVVVSANNGATWSVRAAPQSTVPFNNYLVDPSVGVDSAGRIYLGYQRNDGNPYVVTSDDKGLTWRNNQDVGAAFGIKNSTFPVVVGGSDGRAAYAFLGTTRDGDYGNRLSFQGEWHVYIATTFDAGVTWTTVNATPNDPVQRGSICNKGTTACTNTPNDRNLLDFNDISVDEFGRVVVAYADGCVSNACIQGGPNNFTDNQYIARQSGGRRLIAAHDPDPPEPAPPAPPRLSGGRSAPGVVHLTWTAPDHGGSSITGYEIFRGLASGSTAFLAEVGVQNSYDDITADAGTAFYYDIRAINAAGVGDPCGELFVPGEFNPPENPCTLPGMRASTDTGDAEPNVPPTPQVDINSAWVAEPYFGSGVSRLVFTLFVGQGAAPPNSQWYILWNRPVPDASFDRNYVAMKTNAAGTPSFEYGKISPPSAAVPTAPTRLGPADGGSFDPATGIIEIQVNNSRVDNVAAGSILDALTARTFFARADGVPVTQSTSSDFSDPAGRYTLVGNDVFCRPNPPPFAVLTASTTTGCVPLSIDFDASASFDPPPSDGIVSYTFDLGDGGGSMAQPTPTISHTYNSHGDYRARLLVTDGRGATSENVADLVIEVEPLPMADASGSSTICQGGSAILGGSGGTSCHWSPPTGLSDPDSCSPVASPSQTTTYSLSVTDANGCVSGNTASVTVTVLPAVGAEATPLEWIGTGKDTLSWPAIQNASSYRVYRGVGSDLASLLTPDPDSCTRFEGATTTTGSLLTEIPGAGPGSFYWYLVVGVGCNGDGPAGNATAGPRIVDTTGPCP